MLPLSSDGETVNIVLGEIAYLAPLWPRAQS
jgi:hypothetical protein